MLKPGFDYDYDGQHQWSDEKIVIRFYQEKNSPQKTINITHDLFSELADDIYNNLHHNVFDAKFIKDLDCQKSSPHLLHFLKEEDKLLHHPNEEINYLKTIIGFKVSEIAAILLVERQTIYNWLECPDKIRYSNQHRLDEIYKICSKWHKQTGLENLNLYIRRRIYKNKSLFDLFKAKKLNLRSINNVINKLNEAIKKDTAEKERHKEFIKKHGLMEDSKKRRKWEAGIHRSIG
jgi:hypothetical protein